MDFRIRGLFKPAIRIGDRYVVIDIVHGVLLGQRRTWVGGACNSEGDAAARKVQNGPAHLWYFHGA
jgi:hypothetical protein